MSIRDIIQYLLLCVEFFFILYIIGYSTFLFLSVVIGSIDLYTSKRRNLLRNELENDYYLPVSVLVPAHNEETTINATIKSLLNLDYKLYEIIVVDDGSSDDTAKAVIDEYDLKLVHKPIRELIETNEVLEVYETRDYKVPIVLIKKKNGGKADALNVGINGSNYPYFVCIDADSVLQSDSLEKIVRPVLLDPKVVAVGGAIRPCNGAEIEDGKIVKYRMPKRLLAAMQVLEYDRSFLAARILFDKFNGNIIISGAFGLFNKKMVIAAGGYEPDTMGEDMELVVKLHVFCKESNIDYRIRYASDAICWTQVPERLKDLIGQRRRWHIGLFQSMMKYKEIFANPKYGAISFVSYFYFLLYELYSPYIEIFGLLTTLIAFMVDLINVPFMILFFIIYVVYTAILSLTAFFARVHTIDLKLYLSDALKAIGLCAIEVSCLRFIMAWTRMTALIGYRKKKHDWGKIERQKIDIK